MTSLTRAILCALCLCLPGMSRGAEPRPDGVPPELASRITEAERLFQIQDYERVVALLDRLAGHPRLEGQPQHVRVLEMLGASHWFSGNKDSARLVFGQLLREAPFHRLDGFVYPAELIDFYEVRRRELVTAGIIPASPAESDAFASRRVLVREIARRDVPDAVYLVPFGVGQFANGDTGKGTVLAIVQGLAAVTMAASWFGIEGLKVDGSDRIPPGDGGLARLLEGLWYGGAGVFLVSYGFGVVDGFASREDAPRVEERFELLEPNREPARPAGPSARLAPSFLGGPGARLDVTF